MVGVNKLRVSAGSGVLFVGAMPHLCSRRLVARGASLGALLVCIGFLRPFGGGCGQASRTRCGWQWLVRAVLVSVPSV